MICGYESQFPGAVVGHQPGIEHLDWKFVPGLPGVFSAYL